jgi:hypothetical protein
MDTKSVVRREWEEVGADAYRLASYWVRRACNATGRRFDADLVSDAVCLAYSRYSKRRGRVEPRSSAKLIQSFIRTAAKSTVLNARADMERLQEDATSEPVQTQDAHIVQRDATLVDLLLANGKPKLAALVIAIMQSQSGSLADIGDLLGVTKMTVCNWQRQLRQSTELWLAFPLEYSRYWSTENQVSRLVDMLCR